MTDQTTTFRYGHMVRLHGFDDITMNGKLARVISLPVRKDHGKNIVELLDDSARPPVSFIPEHTLLIQPERMQHACQFCLLVSASLMMCGKCKTAQYCNAECQRADWARHKINDCRSFGHQRGMSKPLPLACARGEMEEVRRLVEDEGEDVDKATSTGPTPLIAASLQGKLAVVQYLVEHGADKDKANYENSTALWASAHQGHLAVVEYLVGQGANKDKTGIQGTPLCIAAHKGHLAVVRYLVEQGADKDGLGSEFGTPLLKAAASGHLAVVQYLVEQGADKDMASSTGATPLIVAVLNGSFPVVQYLVEQGADKNKAALNDGGTPLQIAIYTLNVQIVAYLVAAGCT